MYKEEEGEGGGGRGAREGEKTGDLCHEVQERERKRV